MQRQGEMRVQMVGVNNKRQITAVFCGTMLGEFLPVQLIYQGKTDRCHPKFSSPLIGTLRIHQITGPRCLCHTLEYVGEDKTALVIIDDFKGQVTESVIQPLEDHNVHMWTLPPNTTDLLQPMDISVNKPVTSGLILMSGTCKKLRGQLDGRDLVGGLGGYSHTTNRSLNAGDERSLTCGHHWTY